MTGSHRVPVVSFDEVGKIYPGPPPVTALRGCTTRILPGEYVAVQGRSGAGKSTFLNIVGLLDRPTQGRYLFDGIDTSALRERDRTRLRGGSIGFVFQSFHLLHYRSALENVQLGLTYAGTRRGARPALAAEALARVGLQHKLHSLPSALSGGEKQRVAVARALATSPRLLLCDEPTGNLDTATTAEVMSVIGSLHRDGQTVVVITHDGAVAAMAQRVLRLSDGGLAAVDVTATPVPASTGTMPGGTR
ncbi:MAG TPA: ABC transporter ATP-binding protein [Streptosporangiaceae bacterium]|nr:ABC transporter ATP-binding protein [Streptosporangiaceae bacterium]